MNARPLEEWHEDYGYAVWWTWRDGDWLGEPAYIGSPHCDDWPGCHTHWTPHPDFPHSPPMTDQSAQLAELEQSLTEQARLVGMGAEREAALLAKVAELEREVRLAVEIISDLAKHARGAEILLKIPQQESTSRGFAFLSRGAAIDAAMAREGEKKNTNE